MLNFRGFLSLTLLLETSFMSQVIVCERRGLFPYKCLNWIKSKCFSNFLAGAKLRMNSRMNSTKTLLTFYKKLEAKMEPLDVSATRQRADCAYGLLVFCFILFFGALRDK